MQALRIQTQVAPGGRLHLPLPGLAAGTPVEVIVLVGEHHETEPDLLKASEATLDFWNSEIDDRIWNGA